MSRLTVFRDDSPGTPLLCTEDPAAIADALGPISVGFERWKSPVGIAYDAGAEAILDAYRPYLDRLMGQTGAGSADVVTMTPDHPQAAAVREKFLAEHRHTEPEIRFFVQGAGSFILHDAGRVYDVHCTQGDLIRVPAGIPHWFDAGTDACFTVLRVFTDTAGWVAHFTGSDISGCFPAC